MLSGFYTISSGLLTRQRELDVISNNLVNTQTPGFRGDRMLTTSFEQELLIRKEQGGKQAIGGSLADRKSVV